MDDHLYFPPFILIDSIGKGSSRKRKVTGSIPSRGFTDFYCPSGKFGLTSLITLFVAVCERQQLGVPHWVTSAAYCK